MTRNTIGLAVLFFVSAMGGLIAQGSTGALCTYRIELYDDFGDGWVGSELRINLRDTTYGFFLDNINDDGASKTVYLDLADGDTLSVEYFSGVFEEDVRFAVFNPEGERLVSEGPYPTEGLLLAQKVECPSCYLVLPESVTVSRIRAYSADFSWRPANDVPVTYLLEYGVKGFQPGTGTLVKTEATSVRLDDLSEYTAYDLYFTAICLSGDTSRMSGPLAFATRWAKEVGIIDIVAPVSDCNLSGQDSVKIVMKNFGGQPQSLIPFQYSVNGVDAGVPIPRDGFYTGALGVDSTVVIAFETTYDFSEPGDYVIRAWTAFEEDADVSNDSSEVIIVSVPTIDAFPYFENFETWGGGWTVDPSSTYSSWAYGQPQGSYINRAFSGNNAWVTNLRGAYNSQEFSYLLSPCMDFSSLQLDPRLSFALIVDTELCEAEICDRFWVEWSKDGGASWEKLEASGLTLNWYNDPFSNTWAGDSDAKGWFLAYNAMEGAAGEQEVRIRMVFASDFLFEGEGIGIDDVFISEPLNTDLAVHNPQNTALLSCGDAEDKIEVTLTNFGKSALSNINLYYSVNGAAPVRENTGSIALPAGMQQKYRFNRSFDSSVPGDYEVAVWAALPGDQFSGNDTTYLRFSTAYPLPYQEDFERGFVPLSWTVSGGTVGIGEGNTSTVLSDNLFRFNTELELISPALGAVSSGDVLSFDYRYTAFEGGAYTLGPDDELSVDISTDCGEQFVNVLKINAATHEVGTDMQKVSIPLDAFIGQYIRFRVRATWGASENGDYFIDLDNFFVGNCPLELNIPATVTDVSAGGLTDGAIELLTGSTTEEYSFVWNTGASRNSISQLSEGIYQVSVTNPYGCTDNYEFVVGVGVDTDEEIFAGVSWKLFPNPSQDGVITLQLTAGKTIDHLDIRLYDAMQRLISTQTHRDIRELTQSLDLSTASPGIYFVQLLVDGELETLKLIRL